jgi:hypothetical protein
MESLQVLGGVLDENFSNSKLQIRDGSAASPPSEEQRHLKGGRRAAVANLEKCFRKCEPLFGVHPLGCPFMEQPSGGMGSCAIENYGGGRIARVLPSTGSMTSGSRALAARKAPAVHSAAKQPQIAAARARKAAAAALLRSLKRRKRSKSDAKSQMIVGAFLLQRPRRLLWLEGVVFLSRLRFRGVYPPRR